MAKQQLPTGYLNDVCRMGQGVLCCRFLLLGSDFFCGKTDEKLRTQIEEKHRLKLWVSRADNCSGPPDYTPNTPKKDG